MPANSYLLQFAGVPFFPDAAAAVRMSAPASPDEDPKQLPPRNQQPLPDLVDELDRIIPWDEMQETLAPANYPGRDLEGVAHVRRVSWKEARIGRWLYPRTARRWGVFHGLATSSMMKAMLAATGGTTPQTFIMQANPISPKKYAESLYTVSTSLYLLPARPLAEHGAGFDGLFLVTLVDERYHWQFKTASLHPDSSTTWADLITQLAAALGVVITYDPIPAAYAQPDPDSQLWSNYASAPTLLDAVAYNIGCVVVRNYDGTYKLQTPVAGVVVTKSNRREAASQVTRTAGGDIFAADANLLPSGNLTPAVNAVIPALVNVTFPQYVTGDDPVPHPTNTVFAISTPPSVVSDLAALGIVGVPGLSYTVRDTAKALYAATADLGGAPTNLTAVTALAQRLAQDYFEAQSSVALDETYPGTYAWVPEAVNDIIWTYSLRDRRGTTRVMRDEWNDVVDEMQHSFGPVAGAPGPGGPGSPPATPVPPQTVRDSYPGNVTSALAQTLLDTQLTATFQKVDNFPTQNRWKGRIESETILFEGTAGSDTVSVVSRGVDGTTAADHGNGVQVTWLGPDTVYQVNLTTYEKGQFVFPQEVDGARGVRIVPQMQTVKVFDSTGTTINGLTYCSGQVFSWDPSQTGANQLQPKEYVWVVEPNQKFLQADAYHQGLLAGFSASPPEVAPVYAAQTNLTVEEIIDFTNLILIFNNTTINFVTQITTINVNIELDINIFAPIIIVDPLCPPETPGCIPPGDIIIKIPLKFCDWWYWCPITPIGGGGTLDLGMEQRGVVYRVQGSQVNSITHVTNPNDTGAGMVIALVAINTFTIGGSGNVKTPGGAPVTVQQGGGVILWYDKGGTNMWYIVSMEAGGYTGPANRVTGFDATNCVCLINGENYVNGRLVAPATPSC